MKYTLLFFVTILLFACKQDTKTIVQEIAPEFKDLTALIKKNPKDASLYMERAKVYNQEEAYKAAADDVKTAISIDSTKVEYYHFLSDIYLDSYNSKECIEVLLDTKKRFPQDIKTLLKLSEDYLIVADLEKALLAADDVIKMDNQNAEGFFMLGMVFREMKDIPRAINSFQEAIQIEPELYDAWILMGQLYEDLDNPKALEYFEGAIEVAPENAIGWHSKAFYLQNHGEVDEALAIYRKINDIDKYFEEAYLNAGILYLEKDSLDKAYDQFNILVNISPANYIGYYYRGIANEMNQKIDLAKQDYEVCLRINSNFKKAQEALKQLNS